MSTKKLSAYFLQHTRHLILLDAIGAALTASLLLFVLRPWHDLIGLPEKVVVYLAIPACFIFCYSLLSYLWIKQNFGKHLIRIAMANFVYCLLTMAVMIGFGSQLTYIGFSYFLAESVVVIFLVLMELKVAKTL